MLDRLSDTLLTRILALVDPPPRGYEPSHKTLYACLLVSKRVHKCANPLLWRTISLSHEDAYDSLFEAASTPGGGSGGQAQALQACGQVSCPREVAVLLLLLRQVDDARIAFFSLRRGESVTLFLHFTHLSRLILRNFELDDPPSPIPSFPSLRALSLDCVSAPRTFLEEVLQPENVPSLRHLCLNVTRTYVSEEEEDDEVDYFYQPLLRKPLLDQLDVLQLQADDDDQLHRGQPYFPHDLLHHQGPIMHTRLIDIEFLLEDQPRTLLRHLHLLPFDLEKNQRQSGSGYPPASNRRKLSMFLSALRKQA